MTATYEKAVDEMFSLFLAAWTANTAAVVGYVPEIRWQGVKPPEGQPEKPDGDKYWVRVSQQTVIEEQTSLSACVVDNENGGTLPASRFTASGLLFVQLFCPKSDARSMEFGRKLAMIARNAFRGKKTESGVWFLNVRINPLDSEELWNRFNVVAETEYDEVA